MPDGEFHPTHQPESDAERLLPSMTWCKVCCRLLATDSTGVRARGRQECEGPRRLVLRDDGGMVIERG